MEDQSLTQYRGSLGKTVGYVIMAFSLGLIVQGYLGILTSQINYTITVMLFGFILAIVGAVIWAFGRHDARRR